jgi:hypothetical protein
VARSPAATKLATAIQQHGAHAVVGRDGFRGGQKGFGRGRVQRVQGGRMVELQAGNGALANEQEGGVGGYDAI